MADTARSPTQVAIAGPPVAAAPGDDVVLTTCLAAALLPFFQQALPVASDALMSERDTALALLDMGRALRTRQPEPAPPPVLAPHQLQPKGDPEFTVKRPITCATYLRRLHVTSEMVRGREGQREGRVMWVGKNVAQTNNDLPTPPPSPPLFRPSACCPT